MDIPAGAITRIATDPTALPEFINAGVTGELFVGEDKAVFDYCRQFYKDFGGAPSTEAIETEFPQYERW